MAKCNNNITVASLPTCENVDENDYLIVYNTDSTCKVRFSDFVFGPENVDFYPELENIISTLESLSSVVIPGSGDWNSVYNTVQINSGGWDSLSSGDVPSLLQQVRDNADSWNDVTAAVQGSSGTWENAASTLELNSDKWDRVAAEFDANKSNWDSAYVATRGGIQAIHEALAMIEKQPWYQYLTITEGNTGGDSGGGSGNGSTASGVNYAAFNELWTVVQLNSADWEESHEISTLSARVGDLEATYVPKQGGTFQGRIDINDDLYVTGDIHATGDLYVNKDSIVFSDEVRWSSSDAHEAQEVFQSFQSLSANFQVATDIVNQNNTTWEQASNTIIANEIRWNSTHDRVQASASNWDYAVSAVNANRDDWSWAYNTLVTSKPGWDAIATKLEQSEDDWDFAYRSVLSGASLWNQNNTIIQTNFDNWNDSYSILTSKESDWDTAYNTITLQSNKWNSASNIVEANSDTWDQTYTIITANSALWSESGADISSLVAKEHLWDQSYTIVVSNSAYWSGSITDLKIDVDNITEDVDGLMTVVSTNSSEWFSPPELTSLLRSSSANWNQAYNWMLTDSPTNNTSYNQTTFVNASGDTMTGELAVDNSISVHDNLKIYEGDLIFGDGQVFHGVVHDPNATESLGKQDVKDFKNVFSVVSNNSGDWFSPPELTALIQTTYSVVSSNSANWEESHEIEQFASYIRGVSGGWEATHNWVESTSATNNPTYNQTTYVNASGDTMTGDLNVDSNINIHDDVNIISGNLVFGDSQLFHGVQHSHDIEIFSKLDARNVKDAYSVVHANSGDWFSPPELTALVNLTYSTLTANSASWEESAEIESVNSVLVANSGRWDDAYVYVNTQSATNNAEYNQATFVNVSGDTIVGPLCAEQNIHILDGDLVFGDDRVDHDHQHTPGEIEVLAKSDVRDFKSTYSTVFINSGNWFTPPEIITLLNTSSANWNYAYDSVINNEDNWNATHTRVELSGDHWDHAHTIVLSNSANWSATFSRVYTSGDNWDNTYNRVDTSGDNWDEAYEIVDTNKSKWTAATNWVVSESATNNTAYNHTAFVNTSGDDITGELHVDGRIEANDDINVTTGEILFGDGDYDHDTYHHPERLESLGKSDVQDFKSTYSTVFINSGSWFTPPEIITLLNSSSARWNSTHTSVFNTSGDWDSTHASVNNTSGDWDSVYSFVNADSATNNTDYNRTTFVNVTGDTITGDLEISNRITSNEAVFTSLTALSSVVDVIDIKVRELSGYDIIDGDLSVDGDVTADHDLYITHGELIFGDSGMAHGHDHTPEDIEHLTKLDVRDFKSVYTTVLSNSGSWFTPPEIITLLNSNSANWISTHASVLATSGNWDSTHASVVATSSDWDSTHASVLATSANWDSTHASVLTTSANWDTVYADVSVTSGNWDSTHASVLATSSDWDSVYSFVNTDSATNNTDYNRTTFVNVSGDTIAGDLSITGHLDGTTAVFTSITALSSVVDVIDIKVRELSGYDIIDGDLSVDGDVSAQDNLYITDGEIVFGDNHLAHGFVHAPEEIEKLTKYDVRNFKSTYDSVLTTSANWDNTYMDVSTTSANWNSTHSSVLTTSANWDTVYTDVSISSAYWDSVYSFVNTDSATNNTDYNRTTFVNVTGDTITGPLCAEQNLHVLEGDIVFGDDGLAHGHEHTPEDIEIFSKQDLRDFKSTRASVNSTSGDWNSVYNSVTNTSADWNSTHTSVYSTSGDWDSVYSFVNTDSGTNNTDYNRTTFVNTSGDTINGDLNITGHLEGTTAVFTSITALSSVVDVIDIKARELSGYDIIDGNLSVDGDVSAQDNLYITDGELIFGDNHMVHGFAHTPEEIEKLTKYDVRDFKSTHASVLATSANWDTVYADVSVTSANWDSTHASVLATSANWDTVYADVSVTSANWDSTHASVYNTSANWDTVYADVSVTSANWDSTHASVLATSSYWDSTHASVLATSGDWDSVYSFVNTDSATNNTDYNRTTFVNTSGDTMSGALSSSANIHLLEGDLVFGDDGLAHGHTHTPEDIEVFNKQNLRDFKSVQSSVSSTSGVWDSTHTSVFNTSANWDSTHASVLATSSDWDSVYSFVNTDSATNNTDYNRTTFVNTSGDTITGDLAITGHLDATTAVFTSITALSSVVDVIDIKARELSGYDIIDGNLSVDGDVSAQNNLYVTDGKITFGDNHMVHGFAHTSEEIEDLTKYDVRDFKSTYNSVLTTSANWDAVYADVSVTSANWDSTHASVYNTSANWDAVYADVSVTSANWDSTHASVLTTSSNWDSTYASVLDTSANWDSVYSFVNADSATNNTDYNRTTFVNVTGDTITGPITSTSNLHLLEGEIVFGDDGFTHSHVHTPEDIEVFSKQDLRDFKSTENTVNTTSGRWESVYSFVNTDSATNNTDYNRTTFVNVTGDSITGSLEISDRITSNEAVFTSLTALSSVVDVIDIKARELSGYDIIDGNLSVEGDVSVQDNLYVTDGEIIFGDNHMVHGFAHTPEEIEKLTKFDVRDFKSTHQSVFTTSANWDTVYADVSVTSANWDSTHASVLTTSANWDSTHASVLATSAYWDAVYSFVNTDSATNNTEYNQTTFVNASGDTITGSLSVTEDFDVDGNTRLRGDLIVDGDVWFTAGNQGGKVTINLGDNDTDNIVFNADVDSNIAPDKDNTYTLGTTASHWKKLHVQDVEATNDITAENNLYVTHGDVIFGDSNYDHGHVHTPEEIEHLTKQNVRDFKSVQSSVYNTSANWDTVYADVSVTSANWDSTHNSVLTTSATWDAVYSFVNSDSATNNTNYNQTTFVNASGDVVTGELQIDERLELRDDVNLISGEILFGDGDWDHDTYHNPQQLESLTKQNVKDFKSVQASVFNTSGDWDSVYSFVNTDSATNNTDYNRTTFVNTSGDTITGDLEITNRITSNEAVFTSLTALSSVVDVIDIKARELSGYDIIDGNLSVDGDTSVQNNLYVTDGKITFGDNHMVHGFAHTPEEIEDLTKYDVRNFKSTHTTVFTNSADWGEAYSFLNAYSGNWESTYQSVLATSANWDTVYADVSVTSANWDSTHASVYNTSANWDTVYADVSVTSANWNSVYSFVNSDSATNNSIYNHATYVDVAGDVMTGSLEVKQGVITEVVKSNDPQSALKLYGGSDNSNGARLELYGTNNDNSQFDGRVHLQTNDLYIGDIYDPVDGSKPWMLRIDVDEKNFIIGDTTAIDDSVLTVKGRTTIDGDTRVIGDVTVGNILFNGTGEIESLTKQDIRDFKSTESTVNTTSGRWESVYSFVNTDSATNNTDYNRTTFVNVTGDTITGDLEVSNRITSNEAVFTSLTALSSVVDVIDIKVRELSGYDIIDGDLKVEGDITADHDLYVTDGKIVFGDDHDSHGVVHTASEIEELTKYDVRDFKSTHASVLATSSNWDSTHASVLATSSNWDSTHASVLATSSNWDSTHASVLATSSDWDSTHASVLTTSSNWDSTHASVLATSSDWDSVYSFVNTDSATNNTDYNRTTFVNVTGDTITGDLEVSNRITSNEAVFTSLTALSSYIDVVDIKVRELSGYDIIDGDLRVDGDVTTEILRLSDLHDPLYYIETSSVYNFTNDKQSRLSDKDVYTHAVNVFGDNNYEINGIFFEKEQTGTGDDWQITGGMGNALHKEQPNIQGVVSDMLNDNFRYLVNEQKVILQGLTVGKRYAFYLYSQAWSTDNIEKKAVITCSSSDEQLVVDQNQYETSDGDGHLIEYLYTANSSTVEIIITPDADSSWHLYAFANREIWNYDSQTLTSGDVYNFQSTYTTTYSNSSKWESVYSFVNGDSATNNTEYNHANYVTVSGDTMTGSLSVQQDLTVDGTTMLSGEMFIDGHTTFNNGVTAENNVYIKGDLRVDGNVWLIAGVDSVIHVGDSIDDVVVFQAPVDSDIAPFKPSERDLGSATNTWRNVYADAFILQDGTTLSGSNFESIYAATNVVTSTSGEWNYAYDQVNVLTQETSGLTERVQADYHYSINSYDKSITTLEPSLSDYLQDEFTPGDVVIGDTVIVAAVNTVYILANDDPYDLNSWIEVNAKPNQLFYKTNLITGATIDIIDLDKFKSAKYFIEVENRSGELLIAELSLLSTGSQDKTKLIEQSINYTTDEAFVDFEAVARGKTCELIMHEKTNYETLWDPGTLSSVPYTWLDAADETKVIVDSNNRFNRWEGSGWTDLYMYSPAGAEPEYITSGDEMQNGKNVFKFTNDSDFLQSNYHDGTSVGKWNEDPVIWYLVFKPTGIDNFHDYLLWFEQDNGQDLAIGPDDNDEFFGNVWMKNNKIGNGAYPFTNNFSSTDLQNQWNIFQLEINPKTQKTSMYLNGHVIQKNAPTDYEFPKTSEHMFRLHANWIGSEFTDGYFAEFLVLEDYKRIKTEGYLAWKWGLQDKLPADHTYKNFPPQANNIVKGNRTNLF